MKRIYFKYPLILFSIAIHFIACKSDVEEGNNEFIEEEIWEVVAPNLDGKNNYIYDVGKKVIVDLDDEISLKIGEKSAEFKLIQMLKDHSFEINNNEEYGWITLDQIDFINEDFSESAIEQLENIAHILNAFPESKLKFGGFTDDRTRNDEAKLIVEKVVQLLLNMEIDRNRFSYRVYGNKYFVCPSNDTDLCRAQNRRVDIRLEYK